MAETFNAEDIEIGYHPEGYRIDKTASPMNRYTKWDIQPDGQWKDPVHVCFDALPLAGWYRCNGFDWTDQTRTPV